MQIDKVLKFLEQRYGPFGRWYRDPFQVLIGCVLSQRTREENTAIACKALFSVARTPAQILKLPMRKLQRLIKPAGFWRQKAKRIKLISKVILQRYRGKVPSTRAELLALPGVGFKTADVTLMLGHGIPSIAIDVHCERIPKRLGLVPEWAGVEEVKKRLESLVPKEKWHVVNRGFVLFGRDLCKPIKPKCEECTLKSLCRHAKELFK